MAQSYDSLAPEYDNLWASLALKVDKAKDTTVTAKKIILNRGRYEYIAAKIGAPWPVVGTVHAMESNCDFDTHLHNGDPLTAKTRQVPKGRPAKGKPPFTWEVSACDALQLKGWDKIKDWPVSRICFELERYNGFGYRDHHSTVLSPYLWSGTNHYTKGKYVSDGKWSAAAVSGQSGAMAILKRMSELDKSIKIGSAESLPVTEPPPPSKVAMAVAVAKSAVKSKSVWNQVIAVVLIVWGYIYDGVHHVVSTVAGLVNDLPTVVGEAGTQIESTQTMLGWVGIPWAGVSLAVALGMMTIVVIRHSRDKHKLETKQ